MRTDVDAECHLSPRPQQHTDGGPHARHGARGSAAGADAAVAVRVGAASAGLRREEACHVAAVLDRQIQLACTHNKFLGRLTWVDRVRG